MVKIMENPIKMDDLGEKPPIFGSTSKMGPILMPPQSPHLKLLHEGI